MRLEPLLAALTVLQVRGWIHPAGRLKPASRRGEVRMVVGGLFSKQGSIDLRSDTVTQPTKNMRKLMCAAEVGDDVFCEDPSTTKLEMEVAELMGKDAALFVPSGTMANLIASLVWCNQRGSEMIVGDLSHMFLWEQSNAAQFGGIGYRPLRNEPDGTLDLSSIKSSIRSNNVHFPVTRLISLENTHNSCGGRVLSAAYVDSVAEIAVSNGIRLHVDGARIWNAAEQQNVTPASLVVGADSVSVCFSKGLAAPAGSAVCGSTDFIARARRVRKALGGGMRQSGILAAAASEGLRKMLPRIGEDHATAKRLAEGIAAFGGPPRLAVDPASVETNIVMAQVSASLREQGVAAAEIVEGLKSKGVLCVAMSPTIVRFVTHYQISQSDVSRAIGIIKEVVTKLDVKNSSAPAAAPVLDVVKEVNSAAALAGELLQESGSNDVDGTVVASENAPKVVKSYAEVEIEGMGVSDTGFVAVLSDAISGRAVVIPVTPADPMTSGLDTSVPGTPEALTLLQLMQGIDMGSHLPLETLSNRMKVRCPRLTSITFEEVGREKGGFKAILKGVQGGPPASVAENSAAIKTDSGAHLFADREPLPGDVEAVLASRGIAVPGGDLAASTALALPQAPPPATPPVECECVVNSGFEAVALALRYSAKLHIDSSKLGPAAGDGAKGPFTFDVSEIDSLYPQLVKMVKGRRSPGGALVADSQGGVGRVQAEVVESLREPSTV